MLDAFFCKNDLNSLLTKLDPLSDTTISGKPREAKVDLILSIWRWQSSHSGYPSTLNGRQ